MLEEAPRCLLFVPHQQHLNLQSFGVPDASLLSQRKQIVDPGRGNLLPSANKHRFKMILGQFRPSFSLAFFEAPPAAIVNHCIHHVLKHALRRLDRLQSLLRCSILLFLPSILCCCVSSIALILRSKQLLHAAR